MHSLTMKSFWHVTGVRKGRKCPPRQPSDDTTEIAKGEAPVTVEWLSTSDDSEEGVDVPATTSAAEKEPTKVPAPTSAAKKETTKFIAL